MTVIIHSRFNPPPPIDLHCEDETLTQQHFAQDCDVNNILAKFLRTGLLESIGPGQFEDLTSAPEYREALHIIMEAEEVFSSLPSQIRKEFGNSPSNYLEFIHNPDNKEKAQELGLLKPPPAPVQPVAVQIVGSEAAA